MNKCKTCAYWHNKQRELNYWDTTGICLCPSMKFDIANGRLLGVLDRENQKDRSKVTGNPSHDIETMQDLHNLNSSRYSIVTTEDFGCILHKKKQ